MYGKPALRKQVPHTARIVRPYLRTFPAAPRTPSRTTLKRLKGSSPARQSDRRFGAPAPHDWSRRAANQRRLLSALYPGNQCTAGCVPVRVSFAVVALDSCHPPYSQPSARTGQCLARLRDILFALALSFSPVLALPFIRRTMIVRSRC